MELKLKYAEIFPEVWNALDNILRIGWIKRNIKNGETDQEHTISCMKLVIRIRPELSEFSDNNILDILDELEIHEYPEWEDGDNPALSFNQEEKKRLKSEKFERERRTMLNLCMHKGEIGIQVFKHWLSFEKIENGKFSFSRQIDWYQSIEKAWEYQMKGENVSALDFINYYRNDISHPVLQKKILEIENLAKSILI